MSEGLQISLSLYLSNASGPLISLSHFRLSLEAYKYTKWLSCISLLHAVHTYASVFNDYFTLVLSLYYPVKTSLTQLSAFFFFCRLKIPLARIFIVDGETEKEETCGEKQEWIFKFIIRFRETV